MASTLLLTRSHPPPTNLHHHHAKFISLFNDLNPATSTPGITDSQHRSYRTLYTNRDLFLFAFVSFLSAPTPLSGRFPRNPLTTHRRSPRNIQVDRVSTFASTTARHLATIANQRDPKLRLRRRCPRRNRVSACSPFWNGRFISRLGE